MRHPVRILLHRHRENVMPILVSLIRCTVLLAGCLAAPAQALDAPPPLDKLERERFTVSGLSSGAAMAVQLAVVHSARVSGVGIVSGPPYLCAQGFVTTATNDCLIIGRSAWRAGVDSLFESLFGLSLFDSGEHDIAVQDLIGDTTRLARLGRIDPVTGIARLRVWEYRGSEDRVVGANASAAQATYFRHFGARVVQDTARATPHTMPTSDPAQGACDTGDTDFVSGCDFDAAGSLLRNLLDMPAVQPDTGDGQWYVLQQADFVPVASGASTDVTNRQEARRAIGLAKEARVFVPARCVAQRCRIHVALHGCRQGMQDASYRAFTDGAGYVRWAGPLRLVLLFPRVEAIRPFERGMWDSVGNPQGCWDWWGYTTPGDLHGYATRDAPQIRTLMNMVDHLARPAH
jgi:hypothetical protein